MARRAPDIEHEAFYQAWDRWPITALAARFARRVQPLFQAGWPDAPSEHVAALQRALLLAETLAAHPPADTATAYRTAMALTVAARTTAAHAGQAHPGAAEAARAIATAAATAASAAYEANAAIRAANTATHAAAAVAAVVPDAVQTARAAAGADAQRLRRAVEAADIAPPTAISPDWFGPMWPDGGPEGWPAVDPATGRPV